MSTTEKYPETECVQCGEDFELGYNAEYCSEDCLHASRGESVLNLLKHDHRFCHGCLCQLKEVERPTDEQLRSIEGMHSAESVVGFQYATENADVGEKTIRADVIDTVATGIVCGNCGTTDHRDDFQRDFEPTETAKRLRKRIQETRQEGQHDYSFRAKDFVEAWNDSGGEWVLAVGKALEK